jgi:hypothetical protein
VAAESGQAPVEQSSATPPVQPVQAAAQPTQMMSVAVPEGMAGGMMCQVASPAGTVLQARVLLPYRTCAQHPSPPFAFSLRDE